MMEHDEVQQGKMKKEQNIAGRYSNLLIHEKSPYLLQHAYNPVAWRAWNEETFAIARAEQKPVFLSIGYATCHWCHVMEHESFEDEEIAAILNENFIAIKVDREERPDIDAVYMSVCQAMTGQGGWPLTIFMTPDKKPFFAGTYFPRDNHPNRPSFGYLLQQVTKAWASDRDKIEESCENILRHLQQQALIDSSGELPADILEKSVQGFLQRFDQEYGGFGGRPKFPSPHNLLFLLRRYHKTQETKLLGMVEKTLTAMRMGGIFDHIGYGFHRYSTDREWLLPHFEKMLYDQAMLMMAYTECFQLTKNPFYAQCAEEIGTYVLRDLQSPDGGFYCAEDADSLGDDGKKEEGTFYVWSWQEIHSVLGEEDAQLFCTCYNIEQKGNFLDEATQVYTGGNIPYRTIDLDLLAQKLQIYAEELSARLTFCRMRLFAERGLRHRPLRDEKILADWNGLMISALAQCGAVLENSLFLTAAERAWSWIIRSMVDDNDILYHRFCDGECAIPAFLDDYAMLAHAGLELYFATYNPLYLEQAVSFSDRILQDFAHDQGGFRMTSRHHEALIVETRDAYDGAMPSGNSMAAYTLARLAVLLNRQEYRRASQSVLQAFRETIIRYPQGYSMMLNAYQILHEPMHEVVIAGNSFSTDVVRMLNTVRSTYLPNAIFLMNIGGSLPPLLAHYAMQTALSGKATCYICKDYHCQLPIMDETVLLQTLVSLNETF